jgi:hypothetical protein
MADKGIGMIRDLQWFKDRIGKKIYRHNNKCGCDICLSIFTHGIYISDDLHAQYLYDCQNEIKLIYSDAENYETTRKSERTSQ